MPIYYAPRDRRRPLDILGPVSQAFDLYTQIQQAPLKEQLLQKQLLGAEENIAQSKAATAASIQSTEASKTTQARLTKDSEREDSLNAARGQQLQGFGQQAVGAGLMTPDALQAQMGTLALGDPSLADPAIQQFMFDVKLRTNPDFKAQHEKNLQALANEQTKAEVLGMQLQRLAMGDDSSAKDLADLANVVDDNLRQYDAVIDSANVEMAGLDAFEEGAAGSFMKTANPATLLQIGDSPWMKDPKTNLPSVDPATGKRTPIPAFAPVLESARIEAQQKRDALTLKRDGAVERRKNYLDGMLATSAKLGTIYQHRFDVPHSAPKPSGVPSPQDTAPPDPDAGTAQLERLVGMLGKAATHGPSTLRSMLSDVQKEGRMPSDPAFLDAWVDQALPPSAGETSMRREALKAKLKELIAQGAIPQMPQNAGAGYGGVSSGR